MPCLDWFNGRAGQIQNIGTKLKRIPSRCEYYAEALLPGLAVDVFGGRIFAVDSLLRSGAFEDVIVNSGSHSAVWVRQQHDVYIRNEQACETAGDWRLSRLSENSTASSLFFVIYFMTFNINFIVSVRLPFGVGRTDFTVAWIVGLVEPLATCRPFNAVPTAPGLPRGKHTLPGPTFPMGRPAASVIAAPTTPGSSEERWRSEGNCSSIVVAAVCITSSLSSKLKMSGAGCAEL